VHELHIVDCLAALHTGMGLLYDGSTVCPFMFRVLHHAGRMADDAAKKIATIFIITHCMLTTYS